MGDPKVTVSAEGGKWCSGSRRARLPSRKYLAVTLDGARTCSIAFLAAPSPTEGVHVR
jgi:hypothetical protein